MVLPLMKKFAIFSSTMTISNNSTTDAVLFSCEMDGPNYFHYIMAKYPILIYMRECLWKNPSKELNLGLLFCQLTLNRFGEK